MARIAASVGASLAQGALSLLLNYWATYLVAKFDEPRVTALWNNLLPGIQTAVQRLAPTVDKLLQDTKFQKIIYANIHMDMTSVRQLTQSFGSREIRDFMRPAGLEFIGVTVSTQDVQKNDEPDWGGALWHYPFTYSVPIAEPAVLLLPTIRKINTVLAAGRARLTAIHGGTAGEGVALDQLNIAIQATDYTPSSSFENKTSNERYQATVQAVTQSLSVLTGPADDNPALQGLVGSLRIVKLTLDGLATDWPIMVQ
jgi:hypothetical protein